MARYSVLLFAGVVASLAPSATVFGQPVRTFQQPAPVQGSRFGSSLAVLGDDVAVGAPFADTDVGAVYLVDDVTGSVLRTFANPVPVSGDYFGYAVAAVGGDLAVGAPFAHRGANIPGEAYLFDGSTGSVLQTFPNPTPGTNVDEFGRSIAAVGGNVLVGAPRDDESGVNGGAAYLFNGTTGALLRTFIDPTPESTERFGSAVSAFASNVLIGAPREFNLGGDPGAAYLFDASTGTLLRTYSTGGSTPSTFGASLAVLAGKVLIGAPFEAPQGAVYVFDGGTGTLLQKLEPSSPLLSGGFGSAVGALGNYILIGTSGFEAIAYLFDSGTGLPLQTFVRPASAESVEPGAVALLGGNVLVGDPLYIPAPGATFAGAVHLFGTTDCAGRPAGTLCPDDGDLCSNDVCDGAGVCQHPQAPQDVCRQSGVPTSTKLVLTQDDDDGGDALVWKWPNGAQMWRRNFGFPDSAHAYALCIYDDTPQLMTRAVAPAGGSCGASDCWRVVPDYAIYKYSDVDRTPDGVGRLVLRAKGVSGKGKIVFKGKGPNLSNRPFGLPTLPLPLPVTVQLRAGNGQCWGAEYGTAGVRVNGPTGFSGKGE